MSNTVNKDTLFASRLAEEDVEVPGVGTVRVRALSRAEVLKMQRQERPAADELERKLVALALVEPKLTEDEVKLWQEASSAGELEAVTKAISRMSGLDEGAAKEAVKRFRG